MKNQSRSVVPSLRRSFVPVMAAILGFALAPAHALADEPAPQEEEIGEETFTEVSFGEPGEVTFDASDFKAIFPVASSMLKFESLPNYASFLEQVFNAKVEYDDDGLPLSIDLTVKVIGEPITMGTNGLEMVPVLDPVATMLGGLSGEIQIGDEIICVNGERCAAARNPLTLFFEEDDSALVTASSSSTQPVTNDGPGPSSTSSSASAWPFSIDGWVKAETPGLFVDAIVWHHSGATIQKEGGYNRIILEVEPVEYCFPWAPHLAAASNSDFPVLPEIPVIPIEPPDLPSVFVPPIELLIEPIQCHYAFIITSMSRGRNHLLIDTHLERNIARTDGSCVEIEYDHRLVPGTNVPRVDFFRVAAWTVGTPELPAIKASGIRGFHHGVDLDTGAADSANSAWGTGVNQPCYP